MKKNHEHYRGREQTYLKHFFLERYLERVAYNIGSFSRDFVYVDGFSGPWRSADESLDDTSFMIAINKLRQVREGLNRRGKTPRIRCLFIEKDPTAFSALNAAIGRVQDLEVEAINGEFEDSIPAVLRYVGDAFALVFIDPTGWTGFGLDRIAPVLRHKGEVLVNFMFDHINRFLDDESSRSSFDQLFGGPGWESVTLNRDRREEHIVDLYCERMRAKGGFKHVTHTRILKPLHDRSYFYLIYGTRHPKGLVEFRATEKAAVNEQERVRFSVQEEARQRASGMRSLFTMQENFEAAGPASFERERRVRCEIARQRLIELVAVKAELLYEEAEATVLDIPLVFPDDVQRMVVRLRDDGRIAIEGMGPRERVPKKAHVLRRTK